VLAHVAYALAPVTREDRAAQAKVDISVNFNRKQQTQNPNPEIPED